MTAKKLNITAIIQKYLLTKVITLLKLKLEIYQDLLEGVFQEVLQFLKNSFKK